MFGLVAIWGLVVGSGLFLLDGYATHPRDAGSTPVSLPEDSLLGRNVHQTPILGIERHEPRILVFACSLSALDPPVGGESRR
jgi:hypothetical protein